MKELLPPFAFLSPLVAALSQDELSFWERVAEKWGIAAISLALFCALAFWTGKREAALQKKRDEKDAQDHEERVKLAQLNNELTRQLVQLTERQIKVQEDTVAELKRRYCRGVPPNHSIQD